MQPAENDWRAVRVCFLPFTISLVANKVVKNNTDVVTCVTFMQKYGRLRAT